MQEKNVNTIFCSITHLLTVITADSLLSAPHENIPTISIDKMIDMIEIINKTG